MSSYLVIIYSEVTISKRSSLIPSRRKGRLHPRYYLLTTSTLLHAILVQLTIFFFCFCSLGPHPQHMEVSRLGVESELQLPVYTTATAMWDLRHVWDLHHSSRPRQIPDPPIEPRDQIHILMDTSGMRFHCATTGAPILHFLYLLCRHGEVKSLLRSQWMVRCR